MTFSPDSSLLLVIDLQQRLMPVISGSEDVVANTVKLTEVARLLGVPVLATEQNPHGLGPSLPAIKRLVTSTLAKMLFDATREPAWPTFLPPGRPDFVVTGCEAHICVLQTVLGMLAGGHAVRVVMDATGSRTPVNRDAAMRRLETAGAEIVTTEMVVFEWLGTAAHPKFRDALKWIK